jgi:protein TonB
MPRIFKICSVVAHTIVVAWVAVAQLLAVGPLPIPRAPLTFVGTLPIKLIEPPAPPPRPAEKTPPAPDASNVAPLTAPSTIAPETSRDPSPPPGPGFVEGVVPNGVDWGTITPLSVLPPPPLPPPPQTPVRATGMHLPRKLVHVDPVYPRMAQIAQVQGVVILEATIDARGRVMDARVLRSVPLLDEAALDAVWQWIYAPTLLNGVPVPIVMTVTVKFTLQPR